MIEGDLYAKREQTLVKHLILRTYLERFAHIVGSTWDAITYVDCFSGPWNTRSDRLEDSSFALAVEQLKAARTNLTAARTSRGKPLLQLRCFFLEKDPGAYARLHAFAGKIGGIDIKLRNATLEDSIEHILSFVKQCRDNFSFVFVDPTGWTGFGLDVIAPLLRLDPGEVLVNFMTGHITRFVDDPAQRENFDRLFGPVEYRQRIASLSGQDREEELVRCYADAISQTGGFTFVCPAIVLHPEKDRTHFHLLYATRNPKGVSEFKKAEKQAMSVMERARGHAQQRSRQCKSGQGELFGASEMHDPRHYEQLRERHLCAALRHLEGLFKAHRELSYEEAWKVALSHPLVWESDLKEWIAKVTEEGQIGVSGLKPRERVPKLNSGHRLIWKASILP